ncbi:MAG: TetR/AcrR family transcriptional regulator [Vicinamibacterales bacterium]|nr:TetR/AcrR family transcriptional regulator [Vicinamibacterales bacterium]
MPARPAAHAMGTRSRILATASEEFAASGFEGTTVDRIARRAKVNKAMIYYHFPSKRALYTTIVRDRFTAITEKLQAIAAQPLPPDRKLDRLIETLVRSIDEAMHFLPIFLREIADGGVHLGAEELALITGVFATVSGVIAEGTRSGVFRSIHPALAHFTIVAPLLMFRATAPVRARIKTVRRLEIPDADSATVVAHLQMVARRVLMPTEPGREG